MAWFRPGETTLSMMDKNIGVWAAYDIAAKTNVEPPLSVGLKAFAGAAYPGRETLKHKPFVDSINTNITQTIIKGLDKISTNLDQESLDDYLRGLRSKW